MSFNADQPRDENGRWTAVGAYITEKGFEMNASLRSGEPPSSDVLGMDRAIEKNGTDYPDILYRGADSDFAEYICQKAGTYDPLDVNDDTDFTEAFVGMEIEDAAFLSSTSDFDLANEFASRGKGMGVIFEIEPGGSKSLSVADVMGEDVDWQEEHVFPRGSKIKISSAATKEINGVFAFVVTCKVEQ